MATFTILLQFSESLFVKNFLLLAKVLNIGKQIIWMQKGQFFLFLVVNLNFVLVYIFYMFIQLRISL